MSQSDYTISLWRLDYDLLLEGSIDSETRHYVNAKVVLVGDTGVGKSGLGLVLAGEPYQPTDSTHGRHVWTLESTEVSLRDGRHENREVLLWDLAGQPGYRLIHQLYLNDVAIALVVFDSRSETDPFSGVNHWVRALTQARRLEKTSPPLVWYLVAGRADRGSIGVSRERIDHTVKELDFRGYFETSAREGWQIDELGATVRKAIDWQSLPRVSSNDLFHSIKRFLVEEKESGRKLATADELYRSFCQAHQELGNDATLRSKFDVCIGRVEGTGLLRRLKFGNYVLLQPELLDAYASAMIQAAKSEPDGLGFISEEEALAGRFRMPSDERIQDPAQEALLLVATVEELLRHELALKETAEQTVDLVFPSQFTRERPDAPAIAGRSVVFTFEGAPHNVYATLSVRLAHSFLFRKRGMWRNVSSYQATVGGVCGISLRQLEEGRGELTIFFDDATSEATQYQFEDYVLAHLERRAIPETTLRQRIYSCPDTSCLYTLPGELVRLRQARGDDSMSCPACEETTISLIDPSKRFAASTADTVAEMDKSANAKRDLDVATIRLRGKMEAKDFDVFLCHNSKDRAQVVDIAKELMARGILPWLDIWEIRPGTSWQRALEEQIENIKSVAVCVGASGKGPWQDLEQQAFLQEFVRRGCPMIPVILRNMKGKLVLPPFLKLMSHVDMRKRAEDPIERLIWGVTGKGPVTPRS